MSLIKHGDGAVLPEPEDNKTAASKTWTPEDNKALADENAAADNKE